MDEIEAAKYLGVSVKRLHNLRSRGRIRTTGKVIIHGKMVPQVLDADVIYYRSYLADRENLHSREAFLSKKEADYRDNKKGQ